MSDPHVTEARLLELAQHFAHYKYGSPAVYPWKIPGVGGLVYEGDQRAPDPPTTNCCCFIESLLVRAFREERPDLWWGPQMHRAFMILNGDYYGPVHAAIESGFADPIIEEEYWGPWRLMQNWNEDFTKGHTFILVEITHDDRVLVIEANNSGDTVRGVGYRGLGTLADFPERPMAPKSWTRAALEARYPNMRACALRVRR